MKKITILFLAGLLLFGGDYGKIVGKVIDTETNEPLVGADVLIEGTELGAATDEKGEYVILYVPAGRYVITASYLGYDPHKYTDVVVNADQTTILNFRLRATVIEIDEVVSVAIREPIKISETHTAHAVTSADISRLPVTTISQVVSLQPGVVQSDLGTHIRGGRTNEIVYFVDGIVTRVPHSGTLSTSINASAVEEVTVVSGGFDAEYGDALSGVVNIVTKEGGVKPAGNFRCLTDEVFFMEGLKNRLNYGYSLYDFSLGGAAPLTNRLRYFLSGELMRTDAFEVALYKVPSPRIDYRAQARLSYLFPDAKGKLTLSGFHSRVQYVRYGPAMDIKDNTQNDLKYFKNVPMSRTKNWIGSTTLNYMLTAQTLASFKLGTTKYERVYGTRDYAWEEANNRQWYGDYRLKAEHLIPNHLLNRDDTLHPKVVIVDSVNAYHVLYSRFGVHALRYNPYGIEGVFYTHGDYRVWRAWGNHDIQARFDISHSIGKLHEFKTGIDLIRYNMYFYDNNLPGAPRPFWDYYERTPYKIAAYLQDKMDFEGLIARLGLRFDYFEPNAFTYTVPTDPYNPAISVAKPSYKFSPRLGFSLPVTERMKFRFNYGHYFQVPPLDDIYGTTDTACTRLAIRGNTILGNIFLKPQKTVLYEFGLENQFTDEIVGGFTSYFKDIYDLEQIRFVPALPVPYFQYFNVDYGNVKGFEVRLDKLMSHMWSLGLSYTLQFAKGTASWAAQYYYDRYYAGQDPITGLPLQPPVIDYWLDFDERHTLNGNIDLELPRDFFFMPLQDLTTSFVLSYHSGHPYTPTDLKGKKLGDENSARMPGYWNVDMNAKRRLGIGPIKLELNLLITNLFNTKQVIAVYSTTGDPDNHGDPEPSVDEFRSITILSERYSPQADANHDGLLTPVERKKAYVAAWTDHYLSPAHYNPGFKMQVGVGIGF